MSEVDLSCSLERVIRDHTAAKEFDKIKKIIQQLCNDYAYAVHQPHARNGGLIGLAAAAIALGPVSCDTSIFGIPGADQGRNLLVI